MCGLSLPFTEMMPGVWRLAGLRKLRPAPARISSLLDLDLFVGIKVLLRRGLCTCRQDSSGWGGCRLQIGPRWLRGRLYGLDYSSGARDAEARGTPRFRKGFGVNNLVEPMGSIAPRNP